MKLSHWKKLGQLSSLKGSASSVTSTSAGSDQASMLSDDSDLMSALGALGGADDAETDADYDPSLCDVCVSEDHQSDPPKHL